MSELYRIKPVAGYISLLRVERKRWWGWEHIYSCSDHLAAECAIERDMRDRREAARHATTPTVYRQAYWRADSMSALDCARLVVEAVQ